MSLKNPRNLLIIGAVVIALLAGTVLLASYANILPARSGAGSQVTYQATDHTPCPGPKAHFAQAENAEGYCSLKTKAVSDAEACPLGRTEPCCAGEAPPECCPKPCPPDCTKPCCAGEAAPSGCPMAGMSAAANTGCCPKTSNVTE